MPINPPLPEGVVDNEVGHTDAHNAIHQFLNDEAETEDGATAKVDAEATSRAEGDSTLTDEKADVSDDGTPNPILSGGDLHRAPQGAVVVDGVIFATTDTVTTGPHYLVKSEDEGVTWSLVATLSMDSQRFPRLATDGVDTLYVMAENGRFRRYTGLGAVLAASATVSGGVDHDIVWVSGTTLIHAYLTTSSTVLEIRKSTDNGATWGSAVSIDTATIGTFEDCRLCVAPNGDILLHAEHEVTDLGQSLAVQWRSTDVGATWSARQVLQEASGSADNEGGDYAVLEDGTVAFTWPSTLAGGTSYDDNLLYQIRSIDNGLTWGPRQQVSNRESHVALHTVAIREKVIALSRRFHTGSGEVAAGAYAQEIASGTPNHYHNDLWVQKVGIAHPFKPTAVAYENGPRLFTRNDAAQTSGTLRLVLLYLPGGTVITSIHFFSGATAMVSGTHQRFGIFDSSRQKLAETGDDTSTAWGANTRKPLALTTPYRIRASGLYYVGVLVVAATAPSLCSFQGVTAGIMGEPPIVGGTSDTGLAGTAALPSTAAALTATSTQPWCGVS